MRALRPIPERPLPRATTLQRSKTSGTLATWRTNENLKIVAVNGQPGARFRALPAVGQVVSKARRRTGLLDYLAHARALSGERVRYEFSLFRRRYEVRLSPSRNRRRRIVGVRGALRLLSTLPASGDANRPGERVRDPRDLRTSPQLTRRLRKGSQRSALESLKLARLIAETARINVAIREEWAVAQNRKAVEAQRNAQEEERRARLLADASACLDSSLDRQEALNQVGRLLVLETVDWCVLYLRDGNRLVRFMIHHRDSRALERLEEAFPSGGESEFPESRFLGQDFLEEEFFEGRNDQRKQFLSIEAADDPATVLPEGPRRHALRNLGVHSLIRVPVASHSRLVGVLLVGSQDSQRSLTLKDLRTSRDLARRIALSHESSQLYEEAQRELALRREAEARLRAFNVELERRVAERTALLEEATREANSFAYTVAHDLRAPLRAITGFCQALKDDYSHAVDEVGQDYLDRVVQGARRMDDLIRDLLDYARLNRAEIRKGIVDLDELMTELLEPMSPELTDRKARVEVATPLGRVVGQAGVLSQALRNLLSNAVKFVAPGVAPLVRIRAEQNGPRTRILIEDNGIGIASEHQERIFGIFERLNRAEQYPGTGIGLAIVRRAVERLGGSVGVESRIGHGSRFWIEFPSA